MRLPSEHTVPAYDPERLDAICRDLGLRLVVLFGSRAHGSPPPGPESDLDLAILASTPEAHKQFWTYRDALAGVFGEMVLDLALLNTADPLFRYEIMRDGVLLWGDPDLFFEYRAFAYRDFVDSADLRALEGALFEKKMTHIRRALHGAA